MSTSMGPWTGGVTPVPDAGNRCVVLYAGLLYGEYPWWPRMSDIPDGAYLFYKTANGRTSWHHIRHSAPEPLNIEDVPTQLRAIVLLLT